MLKMRTPGPKIGSVNSGAGAKKEIGKVGNTKGCQSTAGGQFSFLPGAKSGEGKSMSPTKSGQSASGRQDSGYSFMPKKAGGK